MSSARPRAMAQGNADAARPDAQVMLSDFVGKTTKPKTVKELERVGLHSNVEIHGLGGPYRKRKMAMA